MKIYYSPYTLQSPFIPPREGALLKIVFPDNVVGYADCHPWPTLGDFPLKEQLEKLQHLDLTPLTKRSLYFAKLDADARAKGVNLFENVEIPSSHYLLPNLEKDLQDAISATTIKIKLGDNIQRELPLLHNIMDNFSGCSFRLDFNEKLTQEQFTSLLQDLGEKTTRIEFFEDPLPFEENMWRSFQEEYGIQLALDRYSEKGLHKTTSAKVLVIKPAIQDEKMFLHTKQKIVFTSYLDHPLGQLAAAYSAATFPSPVATCGLLSHQIYLPHLFQLLSQGPHLLPPPGTGFGFDEELKKINWHPLK